MILAVDPGTLKSGFAIIDNNKELVKHEQFIVGKSKDPIENRLLRLQMKTLQTIHENNIETVVLEDGFIGTNKRTAMAICMSRAAVIIAAAMNNVPVAFYSPTEIKLSFAGYGKATKDDIKNIVKMVYKINYIEEDEADAIAIAYTHLHQDLINRVVKLGEGTEEENMNGQHERRLSNSRSTSSKVSKRRHRSSRGTALKV